MSVVSPCYSLTLLTPVLRIARLGVLASDRQGRVYEANLKPLAAPSN